MTKITIDSTSEEFKPQFAAYFNMAYNNYIDVCDHIAKRTNINNNGGNNRSREYNLNLFADEFKVSEAKMVYNTLKTYLDANKTERNPVKDNLERISNLTIPFTITEDFKITEKRLLKYIPFYKKLRDNVSYHDYHCLQVLEKCLVNNRDKATHGKLCFKPLNDEQQFFIDSIEISRFLLRLYSASCDLIANRLPQYKPLIEKYFARYNFDKNKICTPNTNWFFDLYEYDSNNKPTKLTDIGRIFLACLCLDRKYGRLFLENTIFKMQSFSNFINSYEDTKNHLIDIQNIFVEIFSAYRIRQTRTRINVQKQGFVLGIDMLNEIQKCPEILFNLLEDNNKKNFRNDRNGDLTLFHNRPLNAKVDNLQVRSADRFPYLALKYFDEYCNFEKLRFQISFGKFRFELYEKKYINNDVALRTIQEELFCFGKLNEVEEWRKRNFQKNLTADNNETAASPSTNKVCIKRINDTFDEEADYEEIEYHEERKVNPNSGQGHAKEELDDEPYITDVRAHYNFGVNGNIGIKLIGDTYHQQYEGNNMLEYIVDEDGSKHGIRTIKEVPDCFIAKYELSSMLFYQLLTQKYGLDNNAETVIKNYVDNFKELLDLLKRNELPQDKVNEIRQQYEIVKKLKTKEVTTEKVARNNDAVDKYETEAKKLYNIVVNGVKIGWLPQKIKDYLFENVTYIDAVKHSKILVDKLKKQTEKRIKYKEAKRDITKERDRNKRALLEKIIVSNENKQGRLADWLSRDLLFFQSWIDDGCNCGKLTGGNFRLLQKCIAKYPFDTNLKGKKVNLKKMLIQAKMIDVDEDGEFVYTQTSHPFLTKGIIEAKSFMDLYYSYLNERKIYLEEIDFENLQNYKFLRSENNKYKAKDISALVAPYYSNIDLPRGLFSDNIKEIIRQKTDIEVKDEDNIQYLIHKYFGFLDDNSQKLYEYKRVYKGLFTVTEKSYNRDKEKFEDIEKDCAQTTEFLHQKEKDKNCKQDCKDKGKTKLYKDFCDTQKEIRRYQCNDMLLFWCAKNILNKVETSEENRQNYIDKFKLKYILPITDPDKPSVDLQENNNLLEHRENFEATVSKYDTATRNYYTCTFTKDNVKLKEFGDVYTLLYDPKIEALIVRKNLTSCTVEDLQKEICSYDKARPLIFGIGHKFEDNVFSSLNQNAEIEKFVNEQNTNIGATFGIVKSSVVSILQNPIKMEFKESDFASIAMDNKEQFLKKVNQKVTKIKSPNFSWLAEYRKKERALDKSELQALMQIRNSFSHDFYPEARFVPVVATAALGTIAEEMKKEFERILNLPIPVPRPGNWRTSWTKKWM